jgi:UDP-N-acetylmuramate--alanine ligase
MKHIHLIGIGGSGLSAIARILIDMGYTVSGSDRIASAITRELQAIGVVISIGHQAENIRGADLVVRSSAIPDDNPEVIAARALNTPVLKRAEFLATLMNTKTVVAVAGTHGKTTTTAMIAWMLSELSQDPSFIVGGILMNQGVNARAGKGKVFVVEADEYDRMFLGLDPTIEVITNVEHDHPDCYPTPADYQAAFVEFMHRLPPEGKLVVCAEDRGVCDLMNIAQKTGKNVFSYGLSSLTTSGKALTSFADGLIPNCQGGFTCSVSVLGKEAMLELQVPGKHNILNALAALTVSQLLELPFQDSVQVLGRFSGTGRRFEVRGEENGIIVIDDYAHHPSEIRATLAAARDRFPSRRIWAVWQPHTYSRTQALFDEFAASFTEANEVIVTEIFAAREPQRVFSSRKVVEAMPRPAHFIASLPDVSTYLVNHLLPGDVLLVLSAGDANQVSVDVLTQLKEKSVVLTGKDNRA